MKIRIQSQSAFTLTELMTVVGLIAMLATLAVPNFVRARSTSSERVCVINLNKIEAAKQLWGLENARAMTDTPTTADLIGPTRYIPKMPLCPSDGMYDFRALNQNALCTITGHTL